MMGNPNRFASVVKRCSCVVSFTTDLGTEAGLADVVVPSLRSALPAWIDPAAHGIAVLPADPNEVAADAEGEQLSSLRVCLHAVIVPGVLHISHNLSLRMDRHMKGWTEWLSGLQAVVTLLHYKDNRVMFLELCVRGTAFDRAKSDLHSGVPTTTDWRWNTIVHIVAKLLPLKPVLRSTFKASKMTKAEDADEQGEEPEVQREKVGKLNPRKIESTAKNPQRWAFTLMIHLLHSVLNRFQQWAESCACHWSPSEFGSSDLALWARRCNLIGVSGNEGPFYDCSCKGMRAPECAAGDWREVFQEVFELSLEKLLAVMDDVDMDNIDTVVQDFEEGKKLICAQLEMKLQPWSVLPWKFA